MEYVVMSLEEAKKVAKKGSSCVGIETGFRRSRL